MTPEGRLGVLVGDHIDITCKANDCKFHMITLEDDGTMVDCGSTPTTDFLNCSIDINCVQRNGSRQQCHGLLTDKSKPFGSSLVLLVQG